MAYSQHTAFLILLPLGSGNALSRQSGQGLTLSIGTVDSLAAAKERVGELKTQGVDAIELSASFREEGLSAIKAVAGDLVKVGLVRYE